MLEGARNAIAFTGAGISVASGIPDFRSPGGLWSRFDPWEVASLGALRTNPEGVWDFLLEAYQMMGRAEPNPAHLALAEMESRGLVNAVVTQNIDGLHQRAGSENVVEYHGSMTELYCMRCKDFKTPDIVSSITKNDLPLYCEDCGGLIRPSIVFFGEGIPVRAMADAQDLADFADVVIVAGTSGEVSPANTVPLRVRAGGGKIIEINLGESSYMDIADVRISMPVEEALPGILEMLG